MENVTVVTIMGVTANFAVGLSCAIVLLLVCERWRRCLPPSGFACALLGYMTAATVLDAHQDMEALRTRKEIELNKDVLTEVNLLISFLLVVWTSGNFIVAGVRDLVISRSSLTHISLGYIEEDNTSPFGKIACVTLFPLLGEVIGKISSSTSRFPPLRRAVRCELLVNSFTARLTKRWQPPAPKKSFVASLLRVLWVDVLRAFLCTTAYFACIYARIPALELLINSCGKDDLMNASLLFIATCVGEWLLSSYHMEILAVFGCRVRSLLQGMVFCKATLLSPGAAQPTGYVASLIGVDCMELCNSWYVMPTTICGAATFPLLFWMLAQRAGVGAALCCAAWVVLTLAMPVLSAPLQKHFWDKEIRARDERLKYTTDLLQTIRVVKMYAWEDALQQNVLRSRKEELRWLLIANSLDGILDSLYSSCSSVLMIILFSTMSIFEPELVLNPALSFSCVSLLYITDLTTNNAAEFFRGITRSSLALNRIATFCTADESAEQRDLFSDSLHKKGAVKLEKCSFTWGNTEKASEQLHLREISVDVEPGSFIGIVGFVGSGKSSLLSAILRNMKMVDGTMTTSGCMAYVPQLPDVHNMSIRDNILYGKEMRRDIYGQVLRKCQLLSDLSILPAGDMTEVGEKSSVQRQCLTGAAPGQ
ncbi:ATP-binding cassette sub-family C member 2-like [Dermacentor variabilis]|uniref:ATP-binding cassette sub-family C member 2-like n=1 Tax=Dermacentor variabilis TaxID=34621 RepID=UPI003F5C97BA